MGIILISEQLGSRIGAALAGVPNTILVSLVFICLTTSAEATKTATTIVPIMLVASIFYAWIFVQASRFGKGVSRDLFATLLAIVSWLVVAITLRSTLAHTDFVYIVILGLLGIWVFYFLSRGFPTIKPKKINLPNSVHVARFLTGGTIVAGAVIAAHYLGPLWAGVVSSFPGLATTMYFMNASQGPEFSKGFVKRLPLGVISTLLFIIVLHLTLTRINTVVSFLISVVCALVYTFALLNIRSRIAK